MASDERNVESVRRPDLPTKQPCDLIPPTTKQCVSSAVRDISPELIDTVLYDGKLAEWLQEGGRASVRLCQRGGFVRSSQDRPRSPPASQRSSQYSSRLESQIALACRCKYAGGFCICIWTRIVNRPYIQHGRFCVARPLSCLLFVASAVRMAEGLVLGVSGAQHSWLLSGSQWHLCPP